MREKLLLLIFVLAYTKTDPILSQISSHYKNITAQENDKAEFLLRSYRRKLSNQSKCYYKYICNFVKDLLITIYDYFIIIYIYKITSLIQSDKAE